MMKKLYYNGTVLTMDAPLYAEAVCTENGRICGVGKTETLCGEGDRKNRPCGADAHACIP